MKTPIRNIFAVLMAALLLASCSEDFRPPNMPRGTPLPATLTPINLPTDEGTPGVFGTPGAFGTTIPTLITAVPGDSGQNPSPGAQTVTPAAPGDTSGANPGATAVIPETGSEGSGSPGGALPGAAALPSQIALPGQILAIQIPTGASSVVVNTNLQAGQTQAYQFDTRDGQRMYVTIDGDAAMQVYDPNQNPISQVLTAVNPLRLSLSQNGSHSIALAGQGPVTMSVYVPPANANQDVAAPIPQEVRDIRFAPGTTSSDMNLTLVNGRPLGYRITAQAGQTLTVTTGGNATVTLLAPDLVTMVPSAPAPTHRWIFSLPESGGYTLVVFGEGNVSLNLSIPPAGGQTGGQAGGQAGGQTGGQTGGQAGGAAIPLPANRSQVTIPPGHASSTMNINLAAGTPQAYVLQVQQGQTLYVSTTGVVDVTIYGPGDTVLARGHSDFPDLYSVDAAQSGNYTFVISGSGPSTLTFYIPPLP